MNENRIPAGSSGATDEQILRAIRQRMSAVEPMVPVPPAWERGEPAARRLRPVVRSGVRLAIAPLVLVVVVVALALAGGMANRPVANSTPATDYMTITIWLATTSGAEITPDQLDFAAKMVGDEARQYDGATVSKVGSDQLVVRFPGNFSGQDINVGTVPQVRFVLLPPELYGTSQAPGKLDVPARGASFDQGLPAQYTAADFDPASIKAEPDASLGGSWVIDATLRADKAAEFETWTGQHVNDYLAIMADNKVLAVPYILSAIRGGSVQIAGTFTQAEAENLAVAAKFAAYGLTVRESQTALHLQGVDSSATGHPGDPTPAAVTQPPMPGVTPGIGDATPAPSMVMHNLATPAYTRGTGPIQVDVWFDFKCKGCRDLDTYVLPSLIADYVDTGKVTLRIFEDDVIDELEKSHESMTAANAARCAGDQDLYLDYAALLFANQGAEGDGSLTQDKLIALGAQLSMDQTTFATCVRGMTHQADIEASTVAAKANGVAGAPSVAVAGQLLPSNTVPTYEDLVMAIEAASMPAFASPIPAVSAAASALPSAAASTAGN